MTFRGDLEQQFGPEGTVYEDGCEELETRQIKHTTASKYLMKDEKGAWMLNPDVTFDKEHDHGVYSCNNGPFPYVLRPYKYMCLRNRRDAKGDVMLLVLMPPKTWDVFEEPTFNANGDLIDRESEKVLMRRTDKLYSKDMTTKDFYDDTITQWTIVYKMKRVLKLKKAIDWNKVFGNDDTDEE